MEAFTEDKRIMFANRLSKRYRHLSRTARKTGVTCYRIFDHDLPEFPLSIDVYEDKLYVAEYRRRHGMEEDQHEAWLQSAIDVMTAITAVPEDCIYLKQRQRKAGRQGQYQKTGNEGTYFHVKEGGFTFKVNLTDYLDTGLFLDHRVTRGMIRDLSQNKRVLNLFAYTGSFSVYAAAGGAREVVTVDLSRTYLSWAKDNLRLNGFDDERAYSFVHTDAKQYLKELRPERFDLVIMDPPTFSNSKRMGDDFLDIQRDHPELIRHALRAMTPGGILFFSTNSSRFELDESAIKGASVKDITKATTSFDFEGKLKRFCWKITKTNQREA